LQQFPQPLVVVDDEDLLSAFSHGRIVPGAAPACQPVFGKRMLPQGWAETKSYKEPRFVRRLLTYAA
jgi:hypothetical protein